MKKIKNILTIGIMAFALVFASCEEDAGAAGATGPAGPAGPTGAAGTTGADGAAGADGADGSQGIPGEDGNANVQTITFDISAITNTNTFDLTVPQLTQQVLMKIWCWYILETRALSRQNGYLRVEQVI